MRVGVTGTLGSGKSVFSRALAGLPGVRRIDADRVGHEALRPGSPVLARLVETFGPEIRGDDGLVDRKVLARKVFSGRGRVRALNAIVHPWLVRTLRRRILRLKGRHGVDIVVVDAALVLEWGLESILDRVVVVEAPAAARRLWLLERGLSASQIRGREGAQWSPSRKRRRADIVIRNAGSIRALRGRARRLGKAWLRALGAGHGRRS